MTRDSGNEPTMNWKTVVENWRNLSEAARFRIRWERIPRAVATSMAFEHEPVDLKMHEDELEKIAHRRVL